jgi:formylmethanofuran dehydrogenase subunit C
MDGGMVLASISGSARESPREPACGPRMWEGVVSDFISAQSRLHDRFFGSGAAAPAETALAGNGGSANASANGGAMAVGDFNTGGNVGTAIGVGDTMGTVMVDGGDMANSTNFNASVNGGTAIADASGGDYNVAFVS